MYNISVQMPGVEWSTVPGPRSRGIIRKDSDPTKALEKTQRVVDSFYRQLKAMQLWGCYVVTHQGGNEVGRIKIEEAQ